MASAGGGGSFLVKMYNADTTNNVQTPMTYVDSTNNYAYIIDGNAKYTASNLSLSIIKIDLSDGSLVYHRNHYYTGFSNEAYTLSPPAFQNGYIACGGRAHGKSSAIFIFDASDGSMAHAAYHGSGGNATVTAAPDHSTKFLFAYAFGGNTYHGTIDTASGSLGSSSLNYIPNTSTGGATPDFYMSIIHDGATSNAQYYTVFGWYQGGSTPWFVFYPWTMSAPRSGGTGYYGGNGTFWHRYGSQLLSGGDRICFSDNGKVCILDGALSGGVTFCDSTGPVLGAAEYAANDIVTFKNGGRVMALDVNTPSSIVRDWTRRSKTGAASSPSTGETYWLGGNMDGNGRFVTGGKEEFGSPRKKNYYFWVTDPLNPAGGPINPTTNGSEYFEMVSDTAGVANQNQTISLSSFSAGSGSASGSGTNITSNWTETTGPGTHEYYDL